VPEDAVALALSDVKDPAIQRVTQRVDLLADLFSDGVAEHRAVLLYRAMPEAFVRQGRRAGVARSLSLGGVPEGGFPDASRDPLRLRV
jgi:hypothetical protein